MADIPKGVSLEDHLATASQNRLYRPLGDTQPLALPTREAFDRPVSFICQPHQLQDFLAALFDLLVKSGK